MTPIFIHPSVCEQVVDWLEEAALDAANPLNYRDPRLAQAFHDLADRLRRRGDQPQQPRGEAPLTEGM